MVFNINIYSTVFSTSVIIRDKCNPTRVATDIVDLSADGK